MVHGGGAVTAATDCPRCPRGCGPFGVPYCCADWNHRAADGDRIVCPACGYGWRGTTEEVLQAIRAQEAWERQQFAEDGEQRLLDAAIGKLWRAKAEVAP